MKILRITPFLRGAPINPFHGGKSLTSLKITNALIMDGNEVYILPWSKENIHQKTRLKVLNGDGYVVVLPTIYFRSPLKIIREAIASFFKNGSLKNPKEHIWKEIRGSIYNKSHFLKKAVDATQPDFVHAHYTHSDIADHYRSLGFKIPFILTHHSRGVSESIPLYDYVVFLSHFQQREALQTYPDIKKKSSVIHNCVSNDYLQPVKPAKSSNILFLSNLKKGKGFDILLDAFCRNQILDKYRLSVIGDGELLPKFKKVALKNRASNVHFLGRVSTDENIEQMEKSTLFVVPSRGEGFGTVYIEALCCGLPIIGFPPIVEELNDTLGMKVGLPFDANRESSGDLAQLIERAMNSNLTDLSYRNEFMKRSRSHFSFDTFKKNYLDMYKDLTVRFS